MPAADNGAESENDWLEEEPEEARDQELEGELDEEATSDDEDADDSDNDDDSDEGAEALEKLEEEELEMLTEDEAAEALPVDEAEELRQLRRAAIALDEGAEDLQEDEFVCASCFLVKRTSQLANRRKKLCRDCV